MNSVCVVLHVHQPDILRPAARMAAGAGIFDAYRTREATRRLFHKVLAPAFRALRRGIDGASERYRFGLVISGVTLDLLERHVPDGVAPLRGLVATGAVELLATPYTQSTLLPECRDGFVEEVTRQRQRLHEAVGQEPAVFWNSLGWIDPTIADAVDGLGLPGAVTHIASVTGSGIARFGASGLPVIGRHDRLTSLVTDRFADRACNDWPITADRFAERVGEALGADDGGVIGLFWDLRTFGESHAEVTGIHDFLQYLLPGLVSAPGIRVADPAAVIASVDRRELPDASHPQPYAAGTGPEATSGPLQRHARERLLQLRDVVFGGGTLGCQGRWWRLQAVDHLCAMAATMTPTGWNSGPTGYEAYLAVMQACDALRRECENGSNK